MSHSNKRSKKKESEAIRQEIVKLKRGGFMKKSELTWCVYSRRGGRWDWACRGRWRWRRASRVGETMFNREPHRNILTFVSIGFLAEEEMRLRRK